MPVETPKLVLHRPHGRDEQMDRQRPDEGDGDQCETGLASIVNRLWLHEID